MWMILRRGLLVEKDCIDLKVVGKYTLAISAHQAIQKRLQVPQASTAPGKTLGSDLSLLLNFSGLQIRRIITGYSI